MRLVIIAAVCLMAALPAMAQQTAPPPIDWSKPVQSDAPLNLLTNFNPRDAKSILQAYIDGVLDGRPKEQFNQLRTVNAAKGQAALMKKLLEVSTCPDFIEDKGHYYGHQLNDDDKRALIEYMQYF